MTSYAYQYNGNSILRGQLSVSGVDGSSTEEFGVTSAGINATSIINANGGVTTTTGALNINSTTGTINIGSASTNIDIINGSLRLVNTANIDTGTAIAVGRTLTAGTSSVVNEVRQLDVTGTSTVTNIGTGANSISTTTINIGSSTTTDIVSGLLRLANTAAIVGGTATVLARETTAGGSATVGDVSMIDFTATPTGLNIGTGAGTTTVNIGSSTNTVNINGNPVVSSPYYMQVVYTATSTGTTSATVTTSLTPVVGASYLVIADTAYHMNSTTTSTIIDSGVAQRSWNVQNSSAAQGGEATGITISPTVLNFSRYGTTLTDANLVGADVQLTNASGTITVTLVPPTSATTSQLTKWTVHLQIITCLN